MLFGDADGTYKVSRKSLTVFPTRKSNLTCHASSFYRNNIVQEFSVATWDLLASVAITLVAADVAAVAEPETSFAVAPREIARILCVR